MDQHAKLTVLNQQMRELLALRDPGQVDRWQPTELQRSIYAELLNKVLDGYDEFKSMEKHHVLKEGDLLRFYSDGSLEYFRKEIESRIEQLKAAYHQVDPESAQFYELLEGVRNPSGAGTGVRRTFEVALEQVYDLIDRNPDQDYRLFPDSMLELMDSKLIGFSPDAWLDRAGHLAPIRTDKRNAKLPAHLRLRLEELFRAYVFGCWFSVLALARSILEVAVLDNIERFGISAEVASGRRKNLEALIDDLNEHVPSLVPSMDKVRQYGNHYLHPQPLKQETLFRREKNARDALETLVHVVEELYLAN